MKKGRVAIKPKKKKAVVAASTVKKLTKVIGKNIERTYTNTAKDAAAFKVLKPDGK